MSGGVTGVTAASSGKFHELSAGKGQYQAVRAVKLALPRSMSPRRRTWWCLEGGSKCLASLNWKTFTMTDSFAQDQKALEFFGMNYATWAPWRYWQECRTKTMPAAIMWQCLGLGSRTLRGGMTTMLRGTWSSSPTVSPRQRRRHWTWRLCRLLAEHRDTWWLWPRLDKVSSAWRSVAILMSFDPEWRSWRLAGKSPRCWFLVRNSCRCFLCDKRKSWWTWHILTRSSPFPLTQSW